jgi:hypothetical protein
VALDQEEIVSAAALVYTTSSNDWSSWKVASEINIKGGLKVMRIKFRWGTALIAASLSLNAACNLDHHAVSHSTPAAPAESARGAAVNQTPTPAPPQTLDDNIPRIDAQEAIALFKAGKAVIVDVRAVEAYRQEHTKGALSLPLNNIMSGDFKAMREDGTYVELPRDKRIIGYCT